MGPRFPSLIERKTDANPKNKPIATNMGSTRRLSVKIRNGHPEGVLVDFKGEKIEPCSRQKTGGAPLSFAWHLGV